MEQELLQQSDAGPDGEDALPADAPAYRRPLRRADILLRSVSGLQYWLDVRITTPAPDPKTSIIYHMNLHEHLKKNAYATDAITPIVLSSFGHAGPSATEFFEKLIYVHAEKAKQFSVLPFPDLRSRARSLLYTPISCMLLRASAFACEAACGGSATSSC